MGFELKKNGPTILNWASLDVDTNWTSVDSYGPHIWIVQYPSGPRHDATHTKLLPIDLLCASSLAGTGNPLHRRPLFLPAGGHPILADRRQSRRRWRPGPAFPDYTALPYPEKPTVPEEEPSSRHLLLETSPPSPPPPPPPAHPGRPSLPLAEGSPPRRRTALGDASAMAAPAKEAAAAGKRDELADSLAELFTNVSLMVRGELQGTNSQLALLEKMNQRVAEEYNSYGDVASGLRVFVEQLNEKNQGFEEYTSQIDAIDHQVTEFEAVVSMLDKHVSVLEKKVKSAYHVAPTQ
ncbi:hypothetical protein QYE76_021214 [Lolium multiflorum]|uniref:Biogenesis of lysosome-related organelles complex 1 subunit 2 n=1 Tax=Lolium multiflorum TaxID=4521 RepID=A0AAD8R7B1_LOLMU|nr:hypothetical protein QYE76_021214 [Lolium multiflorum]